MIPRVDLLNGYLDRSLVEVKAQIERLPKENTRDWGELNSLFLSVLEM